jgi:hypothetical protein
MIRKVIPSFFYALRGPFSLPRCARIELTRCGSNPGGGIYRNVCLADRSVVTV